MATSAHTTGPYKEEQAYDWYPINPTRDKNGAFAALSHLNDPKKYRPNRIPSNDTDHFGFFGSFEDAEKNLTASVAGSLSLVGSLSASVAVNTRVIYRDVARWNESGINTSSDWCENTKWGVGYRLVVSMSKLSTEFEVDFKSAAIASEVGLANISFEILAFGIVKPILVKEFPIPGRFDSATLEKLAQAEDKFRDYIEDTKNTPSLVNSAVPFQVYIGELPGPPPNILRAQSRLFAMEKIKAGKYLFEVEVPAADKGLLVNVVREVYAEHGLGDSEGNSSPAIIKSATSWIEKTELIKTEPKAMETI